MTNKPLRRIAFVQLSPHGKSYAMRCDRDDLEINDEVEVLMYAGTDREYFDDGLITDISHHRWECSCHVVNHISEIEYTFSDEGFTREVKAPSREERSPKAWREHKAPYLRLVSDSTRTDRSELREAGADDANEE